jgi:hypothetical protein
VKDRRVRRRDRLPELPQAADVDQVSERDVVNGDAGPPELVRTGTPPPPDHPDLDMEPVPRQGRGDPAELRRRAGRVEVGGEEEDAGQVRTPG